MQALARRISRLEHRRGAAPCPMCAGQSGIEVMILDNDAETEPEAPCCERCGSASMRIIIR